VWLGVWEHNRRAKAFYVQWGFRPVGTETFRLGSDEQVDLLMELRLAEMGLSWISSLRRRWRAVPVQAGAVPGQ
jgi:hypothetical protein